MPHVTQHDEADITALEQFRKSSQSSNGRLSPWWRRVSLTARFTCRHQYEILREQWRWV